VPEVLRAGGFMGLEVRMLVQLYMLPGICLLVDAGHIGFRVVAFALLENGVAL
jgi:hypothetical protein